MNISYIIPWYKYYLW